MKEREVVVTISCMSWLCNRAFYMDPATLKIKPWSTFRTLLKLMLEYGKERATILNFNQKKKKKKPECSSFPAAILWPPHRLPGSIHLYVSSSPPPPPVPFTLISHHSATSPRLAPTGALLSDKRRRCLQCSVSDENKEAFKSTSSLFNTASHHAHTPRGIFSPQSSLEKTLENI